MDPEVKVILAIVLIVALITFGFVTSTRRRRGRSGDHGFLFSSDFGNSSYHSHHHGDSSHHGGFDGGHGGADGGGGSH